MTSPPPSGDGGRRLGHVLHVPPGNFRAFKILIAAELGSVPLTVASPYDPAQVSKLSPVGRPPVLVIPSGDVLFESGSIARYVAGLGGGGGLLGRTPSERAEVDMWSDFAIQEVELPGSVWVYPVAGYMPFHESAYAKAKSDLSSALSALESHLSAKDTKEEDKDESAPYLVGSHLTLADVAVSCALLYPFKLVCDKSYLKPYKTVLRWFRMCVEREEFRAVVGEVRMCEEELLAEGQFKGGQAGKGKGKEKGEEKQ